jgi:hypothetical protein
MSQKILPEKRLVEKRLNMDWWSVIIAVSIAILVKVGVLSKIPW